MVQVWLGSFFRLDEHLDRLLDGALRMRLKSPLEREQIREVMHGMVRRCGLREACVMLWISRGIPAAGIRRPKDMTGVVGGFAPSIKNFQWGDVSKASLEADERGADTAFLLDCDKFLTEGPGFNIVVIKDGVLHTPARGVLSGITRSDDVERSRR